MSQSRRRIGSTFAGRHPESHDHFADLDPYTLPEQGMPPDLAYRLIHDEMSLNAQPTLNLATFVNTWMDDEAERLAHESLNVNLVDRAEYPMTTELHKRDVWMVAKMLHAKVPDPISDEDFIGTATVGSSEAVMLAMIAHRQRWRDSGYGDPSRPPNIVIGGAFQACWEKVFKFFEIEPRIIPVEDGCRSVVTREKMVEALKPGGAGGVDGNTIAIGLVVGTTFTAEMDEVEAINEVVRKANDERGTGAYRVPLHVDGASGGFVLPFSSPKLRWDFRLSEVQSINLSNHKFGLVCPGLGTVVFRNPKLVPQALFTDVDYLGGTIHDYAVNFSRGSWQVVAQYYNFLRLGRAGYENVMKRIIECATRIAKALTDAYPDLFTIRSAWRSPEQESLLLPIVVLELNEKAPFDGPALSARLRQDGWFIPTYPYPHPEDPQREGPPVLLRMVIRENFSDYMGELLLQHFNKAIAELRQGAAARPQSERRGHPIC